MERTLQLLIPPFDFYRVFIEPWLNTAETYGWIAGMGFLVAVCCGLIGNYLVVRRMSLMGDAISHSVLPGLAIAFLVSNSRSSLPMFLGATAAGIITTILIEVIYRKSRIKQDAAIGIAFSSLFALGVILIAVFSDQIDLDQDCVLHGELAFVPLENFVGITQWIAAPESVMRMAVVTLLVLSLIICFYKELLVSSFDPGLAVSLGLPVTAIHYSLMAVLSLVVVSAFQAVGAILVIAMLILPAATASLLANRLLTRLILSAVHGALSTLLGLHLAIWLDCSIAGSIVVMGTILFITVWFLAPPQGIIYNLFTYIKSPNDTFVPR